MNNLKAHQELVANIFRRYGNDSRFRIWPRDVGTAIPIPTVLNIYKTYRTKNYLIPFKSLRRLKYGINGEADIQGIIKKQGRYLCIEVKTGSGDLSDSQIKFKNMFEKFGGLYILARSVEDVEVALSINGIK